MELLGWRADYLIFVLLAPIMTAGCGIAIFESFRFRRLGNAGSELTLLLTAVGGYLVGNTVEILVPGTETTRIVAQWNYLFLAVIPVLWLLFALRFGGAQRALSSRWIRLLWIMPALTFLFAVTNEYHGLVWKDYYFFLGRHVTDIRVTHGVWFWIHAVYSYAALVAGAALMLRQYHTANRQYRFQSIWIVIGALAPFVANVIYLAELVPTLMKDFTGFGFGVAGVAFVIGMRRFRLFDILPVARRQIMDSLIDPVIVLDPERRIVDLNRAARRLREMSTAELGGNLQDVSAVIARLASHGSSEAGEPHMPELLLDTGGQGRYYDVKWVPVIARNGRALGTLLMFHDVTSSQVRLIAQDARVSELQESLKSRRQLDKVLTVCAECRRIRDRDGVWWHFEDYLARYGGLEFTHGICDDCRRDKKHEH